MQLIRTGGMVRKRKSFPFLCREVVSIITSSSSTISCLSRSILLRAKDMEYLPYVSSQNRRLVEMTDKIYFCESTLNYRKMKEEDRVMEGLRMLHLAEGSPLDISIEQFCMNNDMNYYFMKFFESIAAGRTDYENPLPTTIGLKQ